MSNTSSVIYSDDSEFVPTDKEELSEIKNPHSLLTLLINKMSPQPEDPPMPTLTVPQAAPLFPSLPDLTELTKTIQSILPNMQLPLLPGLLPSLPPLAVPGLPGLPLNSNLSFSNFLTPFPPTKSPRKKRSPNKKAFVRKEFNLKPEITGPPFKLEYAPHLKDSIFPIKRMHLEPTPDVVIVEEPCAKKMKIEPRKGPTYGSNFIAPKLDTNFGTGLLGFPSLPKNQHLTQKPLDLISQFLPPLPTPKNLQTTLTPNQKAYVTLKDSFTPWRYNYFKKRGIQAHTNCILEKKMCVLNKNNGWRKELVEIEKKFQLAKTNIFMILCHEDKQKLCTLFLKNCAEFEQLLEEKEKELEKNELHEWMKSQLKYENQKQYNLTALPTYQQVLNTIRDAVNFLEILDVDREQKLQIINCLQYDWTSPSLHPQRIVTFSNVINMTPERLTEILELAREKLKKLICVRDYYWDIDDLLPCFDH